MSVCRKLRRTLWQERGGRHLASWSWRGLTGFSHEWGVLATKGTLFCQLWGLVPSRGSETFQSENRQLTGWEVAINRGAGRMLAEGLFASSSIWKLSGGLDWWVSTLTVYQNHPSSLNSYQCPRHTLDQLESQSLGLGLDIGVFKISPGDSLVQLGLTATG